MVNYLDLFHPETKLSLVLHEKEKDFVKQRKFLAKK